MHENDLMCIMNCEVRTPNTIKAVRKWPPALVGAVWLLFKCGCNELSSPLFFPPFPLSFLELPFFSSTLQRLKIEERAEGKKERKRRALQALDLPLVKGKNQLKAEHVSSRMQQIEVFLVKRK